MSTLTERRTSPLSSTARRLLAALEYRPAGVVELAAATGLTQPQAGRGLMTLERKGLVVRLKQGFRLSERGYEALEL